jgi:predicted enzyme related to lactoylglutathione lyase
MVLKWYMSPTPLAGSTTFPKIRRGEHWLASLSREDGSNRPPQWTPVFVVDSLNRVKNRVRELGGIISVEEMPVPGSAISIFQDPIVETYVTVMQAGADSGN